MRMSDLDTYLYSSFIFGLKLRVVKIEERKRVEPPQSQAFHSGQQDEA